MDIEVGDFTQTSQLGSGEKLEEAKTIIKIKKNKAKRIIEKGKPKSLLDYNFKTSNYRTLNEKIRNFKTLRNVTGIVESDVHQLFLFLSNEEGFEKYELEGNRYTENTPMIFAENNFNNPYYKRKIHPMIYYKNSKLGEKFMIEDVKKNYGKEDPHTGISRLKYSKGFLDRFPFYYNLPYEYKKDLVSLIHSKVNEYFKNPTKEMFEKNKFYLGGVSFPVLPHNSKHKARLYYITPGGINISKTNFDIKYIND